MIVHAVTGAFGLVLFAWPTVAFTRNCSDLLARLVELSFSLAPLASRSGLSRAGRRVTIRNPGGHGHSSCRATSHVAKSASPVTVYTATTSSRGKDVIGLVADRTRGRSKEWDKTMRRLRYSVKVQQPSMIIARGHDGMMPLCIPAGRADLSGSGQMLLPQSWPISLHLHTLVTLFYDSPLDARSLWKP